MANFFARRAKCSRFTLAKHDGPLALCSSRPLRDETKVMSLTITRDVGGTVTRSVLVDAVVMPVPLTDEASGIGPGLTELVDARAAVAQDQRCGLVRT